MQLLQWPWSQLSQHISWDCGYYIPYFLLFNNSCQMISFCLRQVFRLIIHHPGILQSLADSLQLLRGYTQKDWLLSDYYDGSEYKSHPLFSTSQCLELIIYYDDVEVCNPLGSRAKTHKLCKYFVYVTFVMCLFCTLCSSILLHTGKSVT